MPQLALDNLFNLSITHGDFGYPLNCYYIKYSIYLLAQQIELCLCFDPLVKGRCGCFLFRGDTIASCWSIQFLRIHYLFLRHDI